MRKRTSTDNEFVRRWQVAVGIVIAAFTVGRLSAVPDHFAALRPYLVSEKIQYYEWPAGPLPLVGDQTEPVIVRTLTLKKIDRMTLHEFLRKGLEQEGGWDLPPLGRPNMIGWPKEIAYSSFANLPFSATKPSQYLKHSMSGPNLDDSIYAIADGDYFPRADGFQVGPSLDELPRNGVREFRTISRFEYWMIRIEHFGGNPFADPWN